jgi:hypothetical protein
MSKKVIAKNILLGLFVLIYGAGILLGLFSEYFFSPSVTSFSSMTSVVQEATVVPEGRWVFVIVFLWLMAYFILESMTRQEKSKLNDVLHFILGSEMLFYGGFSLLQGGEAWLWIFVVIGLMSAIAFSFKTKKWDDKRVGEGK